MIRPTPTTLTGTHVRLVPMEPAHAPDLLAAGQDEAIWTWLPWPRPRTLADMTAFVTTALDDPGRVPFTVLHDDRVVGTSSYLSIDPTVAGLEIGSTWYARDVWATTVNPECKLLLLGHAFEVLGAARVLLKTDALNARSRAAISKLGAAYDGTLRHDKLRGDGTVRDSAYFSVLATEWPTVGAGLAARLRPR